MSTQGKKDEQHVERGLKAWADELKVRADALADQQKNIVNGQWRDVGPVDQAAADLAKLADIERQLDAGKNVTGPMYKTVDQIYHRYKPK